MRGFKYHRLQNICLVLNTFFGNVFKPWEDIFFCAKYQIERIQIYIDCKISVSSFGSSVMLSNHGKTSFWGGEQTNSLNIFSQPLAVMVELIWILVIVLPDFVSRFSRKPSSLKVINIITTNPTKCIITVMFFFKMSIKI